MSESKHSRFVGFDRLKQSVSMEQVLQRYGLLERLRRSGESLSGVCPLHRGHNPRQFRVNLNRNCWICFGDCHTGGSIIDLVARMEGIGIREAGLLLQDWFNLQPGDGPHDGNGKVILTVFDFGEPGSNPGKTCSDKIGFAVKDKNGVIIYSTNTYTASNADPIAMQNLNGGNIQVLPSSTTKSAEVVSVVPVAEKASLLVYPNPFSDKLRFEFKAPSDTHARINLYDVTGRIVQTVFDNEVKAGQDYNADFTPSTQTPGMYFYRMTLGNEVFNGKVQYMK